ncbi:MAG: PQQ-binding-like beta-propeller repeat protein [Bacillota bacterium]
MKNLKVILPITGLFVLIAVSVTLFSAIGFSQHGGNASPSPVSGGSEEKGTVEPAVVHKVPAANLPSALNFKTLVFSGKKVVQPFKRNGDLSFDASSDYTGVEGVVCFRGNNYRDSASYGCAGVTLEKLEKVWSRRTGRIDSWTGVGWTGQPVIIKWNENLKQKMNLFPAAKKKEGLKEVICGALDGRVYFLDLGTGEPTRPPINMPGPVKGSVSVDPRGIPLLYVGQGIDAVNGKRVPIGFSVYSLLDERLMFFINGHDKPALKGWGAFDSNSLVHAGADTLIEAGENGLVYIIKLNTAFDPERGLLQINPEEVRYRYRCSLNRQSGIEDSVAVYKHFAYFADNDGVLQCLDLNTLVPVWARSVTDDTDSTAVLEEEGGGAVLYTACEVDKQRKGGSSYVRKINALTGTTMWERSFSCSHNVYENGGTLATPALGKHDISDLVIYSIARCNGPKGGRLVAFNKDSGKTVWEIALPYYSWSSPVDVYTPGGKGYIVFCDSGGSMYLIDGRKGIIRDKVNLGANVEGSPAVFDDMVVVGTRGQKIWGVRIK